MPGFLQCGQINFFMKKYECNDEVTSRCEAQQNTGLVH